MINYTGKAPLIDGDDQKHQRPPSSAFFADTRTACIYLDYNGLSAPLETVPTGWGTMIHTENLEPHDVPGPFRYESAPLDQVIKSASLCILSLHSSDFMSRPVHQATRETLNIALVDMWGRLRRGETLFFIKTSWCWLAPWESHLCQTTVPGSEVAVLDVAGVRTLKFAANPADQKTPRRRRRV